MSFWRLLGAGNVQMEKAVVGEETTRLGWEM
jgi:hypothetical protein